MALNLFNIKKWSKMILGKSKYHVNQKPGLFYKKKSLEGYYNDLREKVLKEDSLSENGVPLSNSGKGNFEFCIAVFQYGLGAYDLYLETNNLTYKEKFIKMANWAIDKQLINGAWDAFSFVYPDSPYSAMAQGEGCSLLLRAYKETGNEIYLNAAKSAIDFMLLEIKNGGTSTHTHDEIILFEYTAQSAVLNGWIFAIFGLYDYVIVSNDSYYKKMLDNTIKTLSLKVNNFDRKYWSNYNLDGSIIASPFYHRLHISQLKVLYDLTGIEAFLMAEKKWSKYLSNPFKKVKAFLFKSFQKLREK